MTPTQLSNLSPENTSAATTSWDNMVTKELEKMVGQLLDLTQKYENTTTPQGKNLYGKKLAKLRTKVSRLAKIAK
ncbi:hypothetical protein D3C75_761130 [compost metagenome]